MKAQLGPWLVVAASSLDMLGIANAQRSSVARPGLRTLIRTEYPHNEQLLGEDMGIIDQEIPLGGMNGWQWEARFDEQIQAANEKFVAVSRKLQEKESIRFAILGMTAIGPSMAMTLRGCKAAAAQLLGPRGIESSCDLFGSASNTANDDFLSIQKKNLQQIIEATKDSQANSVDPASQGGLDLAQPASLANATHSNASIATNATHVDTNMRYDGIMVAVTDAVIIGPMIDEAIDLGIPVVTFENDAPNSKRPVFTGTNNTFMGMQMAKVLKQLQPEGGSHAIIWAPLGEAFTNRTLGFQNELLNFTNNAQWIEAPNSPAVVTNVSQAIERIEYFASQTNATAIAIMVYPIFHAPEYEVIVDRYRVKNITYIGIGDTEQQLDLLARKYVHGLLGHLPYDWGFYSAHHLINIMDGKPIEKQIRSTNVVTHIQVPVLLPELVVDHHQVGQLAIVGYVFFVLTSVTAIAMGCWVWYYRKTRVVRASQPTFLLMVAIGVLIMSCGILPLGLDDSHGSSELHRIAICMSPTWLIATGFTIAFSALFSKTSRVNKIFQAGSAITRIKITTYDVMLQCLALLGANILILSLWTALDPLIYVRVDDPGTDGWHRVLSTSGKCQSDNMTPYIVPLILINMLCLGIANWQAYQGRFINSEFSEAKYIGIACISMLQTGLMGIPILIVVQDYPEALYLVLVSMIFVVSMAVLLLIFVPKIVLMEDYSRFSARTQGRMIQDVIRENAQSNVDSGGFSRKQSSAPCGVDLSKALALDMDRRREPDLDGSSCGCSTK